MKGQIIKGRGLDGRLEFSISGGISVSVSCGLNIARRSWLTGLEKGVCSCTVPLYWQVIG